jgi:hypothetical protein
MPRFNLLHGDIERVLHERVRDVLLGMEVRSR